MMPTDRVLSEMREFGFRATEMGAPGFLPADGAAAQAKLAEYDMQMLGGFVPLVLHDPAQREATIGAAIAAADVFQASGGSKFVTAIIVDEAWSDPIPLSEDQKAHVVEMLAVIDAICEERDLEQVIHPHAQTLVATAADVQWLLDDSRVKWTLDTGHLAIGSRPACMEVHRGGAAPAGLLKGPRDRAPVLLRHHRPDPRSGHGHPRLGWH